MRWVIVLLLMLPLPALAQPVITAENPRGYGWWLGDELVQRIRIELPEDLTLDKASLPRPRAADYWLDLREITTEESPGVIEVTLRWQNFYSALEPNMREVPPSPLRFSDGSEAALPGFEFVTSPIRPLRAHSSPDQLQADPKFHLVDPVPNRIALAGTLFLFVSALVAVAWHQAWGPFRASPARPFTRAARIMAGLDDVAAQRRHLHRAFDAAFGRVLISSDLPAFLSARPEFTPVADRLQKFFSASDAAFFGAAPAADDDVTKLARDLSRIERGQR